MIKTKIPLYENFITGVKQHIIKPALRDVYEPLSIFLELHENPKV